MLILSKGLFQEVRKEFLKARVKSSLFLFVYFSFYKCHLKDINFNYKMQLEKEGNYYGKLQLFKLSLWNALL